MVKHIFLSASLIYFSIVLPSDDKQEYTFCESHVCIKHNLEKIIDIMVNNNMCIECQKKCNDIGKKIYIIKSEDLEKNSRNFIVGYIINSCVFMGLGYLIKLNNIFEKSKKSPINYKNVN